MFCPGCGTQNQVGAVYCFRCGIALPQPISATPSEPSAAPTTSGNTRLGDVPNYMMWSIISTVAALVGGGLFLGCFLGLPMGIVAIVFSIQVNNKLQRGDHAGAVESSNKGKQWFIIASVVSGLGLILTLSFAFLLTASR